MTNWKTGTAALTAVVMLCACEKSAAVAGAANAAEPQQPPDMVIAKGSDGQPYGYRGRENAQTGYANAARSQPRARPAPAAPAAPKPVPYFLPGEWVAALRSNRLAGNVIYFQALAIYAYQHQAWAMQDNNLAWMSGMFSCADGLKAQNEIERPAALARTRAALARFFATPPAEGQISVGESLGPYDPAAQAFSWDAHNANVLLSARATFQVGPIKIGAYGEDRFRCITAEGKDLYQETAPTDLTLRIANAILPVVHVPTAEASAFINLHGAIRGVDVIVRFRVPATQSGAAGASNYNVGNGKGSISGEYVGAQVRESDPPNRLLASFTK